MKKRLLVVEDDAHIRLGLCDALRAEGYDVTDCRDGAQAGPLVKQHKPDLVILDIMLPGKSGFDLCREIRAAKNRVPILMLSAKGQEIDKVVGLELGADDYVTKPFSLRELLARVQALLRRSQAGGAASDLPMEIAFGKVRVDCKALRGKRRKEPIELTPREMKVLAVLFRERGNAVSRDALLNEVWGVDYYGTTRTLDQLIVKLRQKIETSPASRAISSPCTRSDIGSKCKNAVVKRPPWLRCESSYLSRMAKPPKAPRNHHYVPQLLLRRFAAPDGTLWVYHLEKSEIYPAQSKSAGFVRDLYTRMGSDGEPDRGHIENLLAERVDKPGNAAIRRLLAKEDLFTMGPPWNDFLIFVATQLQRTPAFFDRMSQLMQPIAQESFERMAKHDPEFRRRVTQSALTRGISEQRIEQQLQRAASGDIRTKPTKDFVVSMSFALIHAIFEELRQMTWQVATLAKSDPDLILGDQPALPVVPQGECVGLKHPAIHVKLPLSPRVAAVGNWNLQTTYATFRAGQADEINAETMRHAKRFLFAPHRSEELLERATRLYGTGPKVHIRRVKKGKELVIIHEYR